MSAVARRTGLSRDVLRVWERRYSAVTPTRTPNGRRLYGEEDVERLRVLAALTRSGLGIGRIARLPLGELRDLLRSGGDATGAEDAGGTIARCVAAARAFDAVALRAELDRAALELGILRLVERVLAPLMEAVGREWESGGLDPAQEHLASSTVRAFVGRLEPPSTRGPAIVVTTPARQRHDIGPLLAATIAAAQGWRAVFLGPDLPSSGIALAARQLGCAVIALGVGHADGHVAAELRELRRLLPMATILLGGRAIDSLQPLAQEVGLELLPDLAALSARLTALRAVA